MTRLLPLLFFLISGILKSQFADPKYYLIDSLDLTTLDKTDRKTTDSLLKIFHSTKLDTVKIKALGYLTQIQDFNTSWKYNEVLLKDLLERKKKGGQLVQSKFFNKKLANTYYNMNYYYSQMGQEDTALQFLKASIEPYKNCSDQEGLGDVFNSIGIYYSRVGNFNEALKYFQKGLVIFEQINSKKGLARAYIGIGNAYRDINEFDKALENCKKSLQLFEEIGQRERFAEVWNYIGVIYKWSGDTINAKSAYEKSMQYGKEINDEYAIATALLNLGIIYQDEKKFDLAISNYEESLKLFKKIKNTNGVCFVLNSLSITYNRMNLPKKALQPALEAQALAVDLGYPETLINCSQALYETYEKLGMYKEAFNMQRRFFTIKDSISGVESQKKALKTQLEFENEKKVLGLKKEQESKNLVAAQEKKQHLIIIISVIVCMAILVVFFVFLYNRFKVTKRQKAIIEEQNHVVTEKNREIMDSISYAKRLQDAIIPSIKDVNEHLNAFIYYKPKDIVAGDFYWMHTIDSSKFHVQSSDDQNLKHETSNFKLILFAVADSTGHGVPGALVSVVCSNALNRSVNEFGLTDPGKILDKTRELVLETFEKSNKDVKDGMDISLAAIRTTLNSVIPGDSEEKRSTTVQWAGANNPLWYFKDKQFFEIKADKQAVGKTDNPKPFTTHTIELNEGDSLYLFTDGFADQFGGPNGKKYKYKPFSELLTSVNSLSVTQQQEKLKDTFFNWQGSLEQVDDVCVVGIKM